MKAKGNVKRYTQKAMIARVVRECDMLWRLQILGRANGHCEICGAPGPQDLRDSKWIIIAACHINSRGIWSTRWNLRNGLAGCSDCHNEKTIIEWLQTTDPDRYEWIMEQRRIQVPDRDLDLQEILRTLRDAA